jgi:hypothetical protein
MMTLPLGARARIDATAKAFETLESGTAARWRS